MKKKTHKHKSIKEKLSVKKCEALSNHPCSRALKHFEWLVYWYCDNGEIVLDPFAGSGTTALAAISNNRPWVCIEISEKYCEMAKKRIEEYSKQNNLFKTEIQENLF